MAHGTFLNCQPNTRHSCFSFPFLSLLPFLFFLKGRLLGVRVLNPLLTVIASVLYGNTNNRKSLIDSSAKPKLSCKVLKSKEWVKRTIFLKIKSHMVSYGI